MADTHSIKGGSEVQQLVPNRGTAAIALTPERDVLCLNRDDKPFEDMFDSVPFRIEPGFFMTSYGAALHFRARAVVPGSRNPETQHQVSFIAIVGVVEFQPQGGFKVLKAVDRPEEWTPFTEAERAEYADQSEALNRAEMTNAIEPDVHLVPVNRLANSAGSRIKGGGKAAGKRRGPEATDPEVLTPIPPEDNPTVRGIAADRAAAAGDRGTEE